jgi:hypothetical protein
MAKAPEENKDKTLSSKSRSAGSRTVGGAPISATPPARARRGRAELGVNHNRERTHDMEIELEHRIVLSPFAPSAQSSCQAITGNPATVS